MSEPGFIFGAIICTAIEGSPSADRYRINEVALSALPNEWSPGEVLLCRRMFLPSVPDNGIPFYRNQIIHFGASYNHFDMYWARWLCEFERLLTTMCWNEARVHAHMDLVHEGAYKWIARGNSLNKAEPVTEFDFEGGPRWFEGHG